MFSGGFPWQSAVRLLRVRAAAAESQPLSQNRGDCGPFSTDVLATLTLLLLVLLNPAASQTVRPTPGVPALTSRAGASLSFVFLTLQPLLLRSSCPQSGGARSRFTVSVCSVAGAVPRVQLLPVHMATTSRCPNVAAPSPFRLSSDICACFHGSPLHTSIFSAGDVHL